MEKEIWSSVKGYEGLYEVSTYGNVRSLSYKRTGKVKVLTQVENSNGYLIVDLCKKGKEKTYLVHRLVAEAFLPNLLDETQVNHKDENKTNNHVDNLEWCDCRYNINYGTAIKRMVEKKSKPVLQFTKTGELVREWASLSEAGRNGFNIGNISSCCNGRLKTNKGYIWKYKLW